MAIHLKIADTQDLLNISTQEKIDILKQAIKRIIVDPKIGMCEAITMSILIKYNHSIYVFHHDIKVIYPDFNYTNYRELMRNNKVDSIIRTGYWDKRNIFGNIRRILFLRKLIKNLKKEL